MLLLCLHHLLHVPAIPRSTLYIEPGSQTSELEMEPSAQQPLKRVNNRVALHEKRHDMHEPDVRERHLLASRCHSRGDPVAKLEILYGTGARGGGKYIVRLDRPGPRSL